MFDVGFWELLLIGVVTLLVVGPDRLPEVARTAGKWILKARRFVAGVKSDFQSELESGELHKILGDQKEQIKELRSMVDSTRKDIESSTSDVLATAKTKFESLEDLGRKVDAPASPAPSSAASSSTTNAKIAADAAKTNSDSDSIDK